MRRLCVIVSIVGGLAVACNGSHPTMSSVVPVPMPPHGVHSMDWTQPSPDILDYFISESGETWTVPKKPPMVGFLQPDNRFTLCLNSWDCSTQMVFRYDDEFVWFLEDHGSALRARGGTGTQTYGGRWLHRRWQVGQEVYQWCNPANAGSSCPPCDGRAGTDWQACANEHQSVVVRSMNAWCQPVAEQPVRYVVRVDSAGVQDFGGQVGRRHTVTFSFCPVSPLGDGCETSVLARGVGYVAWSAWTGKGWRIPPNNKVIPISTLNLHPGPTCSN